jgi:hypothetical protein
MPSPARRRAAEISATPEKTTVLTAPTVVVGSGVATVLTWTIWSKLPGALMRWTSMAVVEEVGMSK